MSEWQGRDRFSEPFRPSRRRCLVAYSVVWLPVCAVFVFLPLKFGPIYDRFAKHGELSDKPNIERDDRRLRSVDFQPGCPDFSVGEPLIENALL